MMVDIYEPQGIAFVEATGTFLTNELLPLVEKTVTETEVKSEDFLSLGLNIFKDPVFLHGM